MNTMSKLLNVQYRYKLIVSIVVQLARLSISIIRLSIQCHVHTCSDVVNYGSLHKLT